MDLELARSVLVCSVISSPPLQLMLREHRKIHTNGTVGLEEKFSEVALALVTVHTYAGELEIQDSWEGARFGGPAEPTMTDDPNT